MGRIPSNRKTEKTRADRTPATTGHVRRRFAAHAFLDSAGISKKIVEYSGSAPIFA